MRFRITFENNDRSRRWLKKGQTYDGVPLRGLVEPHIRLFSPSDPNDYLDILATRLERVEEDGNRTSGRDESGRLYGSAGV
jgi:hypothetical protein